MSSNTPLTNQALEIYKLDFKQNAQIVHSYGFENGLKSMCAWKLTSREKCGLGVLHHRMWRFSVSGSGESLSQMLSFRI